VARDADTDEYLTSQGWTVLRFWEHEDVLVAADQVERVVRARR
jgi:DNA mismatch endonuclease (patch repair protein)